MDNLFKTRVLTGAVNEMVTPWTTIYDRFFRPRENFQPTDRLAFDIIGGSEGILANIGISAPATVTDKTNRKTVVMEAPRLAQKRFISAAELNAVRAYGEQMMPEMLKDRIAREQLDMRSIIDRTKEFWAANALKGKIYDSDLSTVLVDYGLDGTHAITLDSTDVWTDTDDSDPIGDLRTWKKLIEDDSAAAITEWVAYMGSSVMDALLNHPTVRELLRTEKGALVAESGRIQRLAEVEFHEYNRSFVDDTGTRQRFIAANEFLLVGVCSDLTNCPYAPVIDFASPQSVGNVTGAGSPVPMFAKSWEEQDPSGRWMKVETRPLPVLQRPGAVIVAEPVA